MIDGMPLKVSYGMGVDSTAMLIGLHAAGIVPDLILFADTGGELPETYAYEPIIQDWLKRAGFPPVVTVRKRSPRTGDVSLEAECLRKRLLPSISYGGHSCAEKWKIRPQQSYCYRQWPMAREAWREGRKVLVAIGYDAGARDTKRCAKAYAAQAKKKRPRYAYCYPLQAWGWDRDYCIGVIEDAGLPVPIKSSCFFCGARTLQEIRYLAEHHPELAGRACTIERVALSKLRSVKGLGRRFNWSEFLGVAA